MLNIEDIRRAANRIEGLINTTPLITSDFLDHFTGTRVFLKAENLQKSGAYKIRGALNKVLQLTEQERRNGVIAYSSGNHAIAVSIAASVLDVHATVLMPSDAPAIKIRGARENGAKVILYDRRRDNREELCANLMETRALTLIAPYDDYQVMAGAGTAALEAVNRLPASARIDTVMLCCSGGGLASGWATTTRTLLPDASVYAVEPEDFDDTRRSLLHGQRLGNDHRDGSICDALLAATPGELTFEVMKVCGVQGVTVSDDQVCRAMNFAFAHLKMVLEPSGAAALAAILARKFPQPSQGVLAILSGGNVDAETFSRCLQICQ